MASTAGKSTRPPRRPRNLLEAILYLIEWKRGRDRRNSRPSASRRRGLHGRRRLLLLAAIPVIVVLIIVLVILAVFWTDLLWYGEVGFERVFWTRLLARLGLGVAGGVVFFGLFAGNLFLARRLSPRLRVADDGREEVLELVPMEDKSLGRIVLGVSLFLAFLFALGSGSRWENVLLFFNRVSFGYQDPIFHRDASFFVFSLPVAHWAVSFLGLAMVLTLAATAGIYVLDRAISLPGRWPVMAPHVKGHLSVLAAGALLLKAADYLLASWELVYSTRGTVFGASYTDVHAELPVLRILAVISVISALIFLGNIYYRGWRLPLAGVGLLAVTWLAAGQVYPALMQQYRVSPNEIEVERPYIKYNIEATRWAYGVDKTASRPFPAGQLLTPADIEENRSTIENIRLWDPRPTLETYSQVQEIRLYYTFKDVDVDRYTIDGRYRQVLLAARELDQDRLQAQAKTWVNQHLTYTHGYGVVVSPVNAVVGEGLPDLVVKDIPPQTSTDLRVTRPEIYYGELGNEYVLVNTEAKEFDYPKGDTNVFTTYQGRGGVAISSFPRQLAFALRFGSLKLLVSEYLRPESRIMFRRTVQERVRAVAPFLQYDRDPYLVIRDDGSLAWIWDAYTTSKRFPYAQPRADGLNYIRNSIKVVVNAYDGRITFYQIDPADAVANAWGKIFPGLLTSGSALPSDLRRHLRYPEDLFSIQADILSVYHMQDPQVFYNREDVWQIPREIYADQETAVVPYYVIMALPGEPREEALLLQPFAPLEKKNMIAWMAARMDGANYGRLVLFEFPKDKLIFGPAQVEARISNDPAISEQLTLWNQAGSRVIRGNLLIIPIEDSLLYVEPLYLQAEQSPIPELKRVIASYAGSVVMEPTLAEALAKLFRGGGATSTTTGEPTTTQPTGPGTTGPGATTTTTRPTTTAPQTTTVTAPGTTTSTVALSSDPQVLISLANQHYQLALEAQRRGDWAEYGRQIAELGRVLAALKAKTGP